MASVDTKSDLTDSGVNQPGGSDSLPISPSLAPTLQHARIPPRSVTLDARVLFICVICIVVGLLAGYLAQGLLRAIWFITSLSFWGRFSLAPATPPRTFSKNPLGPWIIAIPVIGAIIIGLIARFGSRQIAGHGIPEAMEQVLANQSRIPPRMTFLKPLSAAISIGTGGPFGAEGPIIASGGAVGSLLGQLLHTSAAERKVILAAGASAGIATAFGCPVAAVLLAIELLLFEFRPRSIIPVALACAVAALIHYRFEGAEPFFAFTGAPLTPVPAGQLLFYTLLGAVMGVAAVVMTHTVHGIEGLFEHLPIHWMWHPAIGAVLVGLIGYVAPYTLGSGYFNIDHLLAGNLALGVVAALLVLKFLAWTISLGSGTAGGTLAPVFTIGGALGAVLAILISRAFPAAHLDLRLAALVGMVAIFAGASRAMLTCVVFAFETTMQPWGLLPALCGCAASYLVATLISRTSIMSEKMDRRGVRVPTEYEADYLQHVIVRDVSHSNVVTLKADQTVAEVRAWVASEVPGSSHQGFPVVDEEGILIGVATRKDFVPAKVPHDLRLRQLLQRPPVIVYDDSTLREAADHMINHNIGRLPVVRHADAKLIGIVTRSDILGAHIKRLRDAEPTTTIHLKRFLRRP